MSKLSTLMDEAKKALAKKPAKKEKKGKRKSEATIDKTVMDRILGLIPRDGKGIKDEAVVALLNYIAKKTGSMNNLLVDYLEEYLDK